MLTKLKAKKRLRKPNPKVLNSLYAQLKFMKENFPLSNPPPLYYKYLKEDDEAYVPFCHFCGHKYDIENDFVHECPEIAKCPLCETELGKIENSVICPGCSTKWAGFRKYDGKCRKHSWGRRICQGNKVKYFLYTLQYWNQIDDNSRNEAISNIENWSNSKSVNTMPKDLLRIFNDLVNGELPGVIVGHVGNQGYYALEQEGSEIVRFFWKAGPNHNDICEYDRFPTSIGENKKVGNDTLIFNITASTDCPSLACNSHKPKRPNLKEDLCLVGKNRCYAIGTEKGKKSTLIFRRKQEYFWDKLSPNEIADDLQLSLSKWRNDRAWMEKIQEWEKILSEKNFSSLSEIAKKFRVKDWSKKSNEEKLDSIRRKVNNQNMLYEQNKLERKPPKYLRFSESGDMRNQDDINKLIEVFKILKSRIPYLRIYGYTARHDLEWKAIRPWAVVNGSGAIGDFKNTGITQQFVAVESIPENVMECPGDCKFCHINKFVPDDLKNIEILKRPKICAVQHNNSVYIKFH